MNWKRLFVSDPKLMQNLPPYSRFLLRLMRGANLISISVFFTAILIKILFSVFG